MSEHKKNEIKIEVETVSTVKKIIRIEIPQETVSHEYQHQLGHLQKEASLPGFRPGKAPLSMLIKKYEKNIEDEILRKLIPAACQEAIDQAKLSPVEMPAITDVSFKKDAPLSFCLDVDILPEITLSNYTGLILPQKEIAVTEEDIEKGLGVLLDQNGYLEALPDGHLIADADYVIVDFVGESAGKTLAGGKQKDYPIQVGSNKVRPEIDAALLGKKKGEQIVVDLTIPADDSEKEIAGKLAHFTIEIKEIKAKRLPVLDEEFAKDLGLSSLAELREKVGHSISEEREKIQGRYQKNNLMDQLIALHPFEVPAPMVARELKALLHQNNLTQNADPEKMKAATLTAEGRVRSTLILTRVAEKEKIDVSEEEMDQTIRQVAARDGGDFEKYKQDVLKNPDWTDNLKDAIRGEKTLNWIYSQSKFETVMEGEK
ncbi:MAG: trigger factor [Nitrospirota bacterium]